MAHCQDEWQHKRSNKNKFDGVQFKRILASLSPTSESPADHGTISSTVEGEEPITEHDAPVSAPAPVLTAMEAIKLNASASMSRSSSAPGSPSKPTSPPGTRASVAAAAATPPRGSFQSVHTRKVVKRHHGRSRALPPT
jgi:hypothetical protein